jgi:hypothetical protein
MIYVQRDAEIIPQKVLDVAARAQAKLEALPPNQRRAFIKKKSHIWRAFGRHLAKMSYGKCWYSESPDPQSFFDVDHYRPKLEAKRSENETDRPGYEWLAFCWENFRYAANCSNRLRENDETGVVEGKGSWFPLLEGSVKACWENRCEANETPVLLDPVYRADVDLLDVGADGRVGPSRTAVGSAKHRVKRSCELYGLNLPRIKGARLRVMREVQAMLDVLVKSIEAANGPVMPDQAADQLPINTQRDIIRAKTLPESPYSKAIRAEIFRAGWADILPKPEEYAALRAA